MSFAEAVSVVFRKYAEFRGTARRSEYWWWTLFTVLVSFATGIMDIAVGGESLAEGDSVGVFGALAALAFFLPSLAVGVRRLRDAGYAWPWLFIVLVPLVGPIILLVFLCQPSKMRAIA